MILWDFPAAFVYAYLFVLGAVVGSFLNVCVHRFPPHESVRGAWRSLLHPPSSCPYCRQRIRVRDNVPILGWLLLRGRCRSCRHWIPLRYPFIELLNGLLFVVVYQALVPAGFLASITGSAVYSELGPWAQISDWSPRTQSLWLHLEYAYFMVLMEALLVASLIDLDLQIIPDSVTLPAMAVGVLGSLTGQFWLAPVWYQNPSMLRSLWSLWGGSTPPPAWWVMGVPAWTTAYPPLHGLAVSLAGLAVGGGLIWFVRVTGEWVFRREAMGFGDVILMALIGSYLGWQATVVVFFVAPVCAIVVVSVRWFIGALRALLVGNPRGSGQREIPYGPYLSVAALWVLLSWKSLFVSTSPFFGLGPLVPLVGMMMAAALVAILWFIQGVKWLLRIPLYEPPWQEEWTSADQLAFFANKDHDAGVGPLKPNGWPGTATGRGLLHQHAWRGERR
jgi:leader peptidase (prepilin peptidase)/N-methyltransferase